VKGHWADCNCIDCVRGMGQTTDPSMLPPPLPGMYPAPMPGMYPTPMPGMYPAPMPSAPAPTSTSSTSSAPQPDAGWLMKMLQTPTPGTLPLAPGTMPTMDQIQAVTTKYQAGVTAFQQLTAVHSIFRTPIMAPHFMSASDEDTYFYMNSDVLGKLRDLLLPIPVQQVVDMIGWLQSIQPNTSYPPEQWILLTEKLILGQKISFPTIELPYRIINFLAKALRSTVTGSQEQNLRVLQDKERKQLYIAIDAVSQAQADFKLAVLDANVPANITDPMAWASNILSQAGSPQAEAILVAQSGITASKDKLAQVQSTVQSLDEQMAGLQNTVLNSDQLAQFLMQNLPASKELDDLKASYTKIEDTIGLFHFLTQPIQDAENSLLAQMSPYQDQVRQAMSAFVAARGPINYAAATGTSPTQDQVNAFNSAQAALTAAQAALQPYLDRMKALNDQMHQVYVDHPEFMVNGKIITDPDLISDLVSKALNQAATDMPSDLMSVAQSAMSVDAKAADARVEALKAEQAEMIQAKENAFQAYYQDQVEAKLQFYRDQMTAAQNGYNELNQELVALSKKAQDLQDQAQANINALGQVIGWWVHTNNIPDSVMDQPYFIGTALDSVVKLQGKFDVVTIEGQKVTMWQGPGDSASLAGETITIMGNQETAVQDYNMKAPGLVASLNKLTAWMTQVQQAFQITSDQLNSQAYAQSLQPEFNATPQGALLQSDIDAIVNPLRQISLGVQADQKTLDSILSDLEKQVLANNGCDLGEIHSLPYDTKKHLWVGVMDHLKGPGQRLDELQGYITQMSDRIHAGTPQDGDLENVQIAKVALMNILAAQNIQRTLEKDINFMAALHDEAQGDTNTAVETIQTAAEGAAVRAGG
jgi:hypothetical protein